VTVKGRGSFWIFAGAGLLTVVAMAAFEAPSFLSKHLTGANDNKSAPPAIIFQRILSRDLLAYFAATGTAATRVDYSLIRDPTGLSGSARPQYYAWVKAYSGEQIVREGAVRFAAVDRSRFEITHFVERNSIIRDPEWISAVFPSPVLTAILARARAEP
jgi:hypothetical protein